VTHASRKADLGPLFTWAPELPGTPEMESSAVSQVPEVPELRELPELREVPEVPERPEFASKFLNDSGRVPRSGFHPYGGTNTGTSRPLQDPISSLAAAGNGGPLGGATGPVLRPYQQISISSVEAQFLGGTLRTLLVLPTGCGKTVVFAELARREVARGGRVLVLAHRTELLDQAAQKLAAVGVRATVEQGDRKASATAPVVVASVQTLRGKRLEAYDRGAFALVIVDEAHHAIAASYRAILEHFATSRVLGVTATPDRSDGDALGKVFATTAFSYDMRQAIREGYLSPIVARRVMVGDLDLSTIRSHHGDFDQGELAAVLTAEKALHGVVTPLLELARDRRTLVFAVDVAHAHALAEVINRHRPASAIAVDGKAKAEDRAAAVSLFRAGKFQFLVNCAIFTEGFDEPSVACVAMARPTQSRGLYTQCVGRGTRLAPGKVDCLVLDFVGASRHRLIGPADALAGTLDEATRAEVERMLGGKQLEIEEVLAAAEATAAQKARDAKLLAVVHYRQREVDPWLGDHMKPMDPNSPAAQAPASEAQLGAIKKAGLSDPPAGLTKGEASAILDAIATRRAKGLATIPQERALKRLRLRTEGMTFARAQALIAKAQTAGWRPYVFLNEPEFGGAA
jgi:superfamily II DNA or RNA helicase